MSLTDRTAGFIGGVQAKQGQRIVARLLRDLRKSVHRLEAKDPPCVILYNRTGSAVVEGDIVVLSQSDENSVVWAPTLGSAENPFVVVTGAANGELIRCATSGYGPIIITCTAGAVGLGEAIIASTATNGQGEVSGAPGSLEFLGVAATVKAGGAPGEVVIILTGTGAGSGGAGGVHDILGAQHTIAGGAALDLVGQDGAGSIARVTPEWDIRSIVGDQSRVLRSSSTGELDLVHYLAEWASIDYYESLDVYYDDYSWFDLASETQEINNGSEDDDWATFTVAANDYDWGISLNQGFADFWNYTYEHWEVFGMCMVGGAIWGNNSQDPDEDCALRGETDDYLVYTDADENKVGIGTDTPSSKLDVVGDIELSGELYFGGPTTEGSWRFIVSGDALLIQQYESTSWNTKQTISGA